MECCRGQAFTRRWHRLASLAALRAHAQTLLELPGLHKVGRHWWDRPAQYTYQLAPARFGSWAGHGTGRAWRNGNGGIGTATSARAAAESSPSCGPARSGLEVWRRRPRLCDNAADSLSEAGPLTTRENVAPSLQGCVFALQHPAARWRSIRGARRKSFQPRSSSCGDARSEMNCRPVRSAPGKEGTPWSVRTRSHKVSSRQIPSRDSNPTRRPSSAARTRRSGAVLGSASASDLSSAPAPSWGKGSCGTAT